VSNQLDKSKQWPHRDGARQNLHYFVNLARIQPISQLSSAVKVSVSPLGQFEPAAAAQHLSRERPLLMPEQLRGNQQVTASIRASTEVRSRPATQIRSSFRDKDIV
jgi:hypothetical protein